MKNLKRVLSLGLASVMLLGMMVMGASAKDFTDADKITHSEAVETMVALGIIKGKEDGSFFDPEGTVTRAEMAKMIAVAMNGGNEAATGVKTTPSFTDIGTHWAQPQIEYCYDMGIINGRGDGTFDPDGLVTGTEAAKMVLTALGYDSKAFELEGAAWATHTNELAKTTRGCKLTDELDTVVMSQPATRDTAAQMIWNGLQAYVVTIDPEQNKTGGEITWGYNTKGTTTLLKQRYDANVTTGVFEGNYNFNGGGAMKGEIKVVEYHLNSSNVMVPGQTHTFPSDLSIDNIGEEVKIVWKDGAKGIKDQADHKDKIFGVFNTGATRVVHTTMSKIKKNESPDTILDIDGTKYEANTSVEVFSNYISLGGKASAGTPKDPTDTSKGYNQDALSSALRDNSGNKIKVTFDDNNKVKKVYVVQPVIGVVTANNGTNITIAGAVPYSLKIADHNVEEGLVRGDVVVVTPLYKTDPADSQALYTVAKAEKVSGELTSYKSDASKTEDESVTVDGKVYKINYKNKQKSNGYGLLAATIPGETGTQVTDFYSHLASNDFIGKDFDLYLIDGYVAAAVQTAKNANDYSVITEIKSGKAGAVFSGLQLQVMGADGTLEIISVSKDSDDKNTRTPNAGGITSSDYAVGDIITYTFDKNDLAEVTVAGKAADSTAVNYVERTKTVNGKPTAADCVLFAQTEAGKTWTLGGSTEGGRSVGGADWAAYDIRTLESKSWTEIATVVEDNGKVVAVFVNTCTPPDGAGDDTVYGIVTNYVGKVKDYSTYTVQSNGEEYTVNFKGTLTKGNLVKFNPTVDNNYGPTKIQVVTASNVGAGKGIENRKFGEFHAKEYSTSDNNLIVYLDATQMKNPDATDKSYRFDDKTASMKTYALDKDAKIIYVDQKNDKSAGESSINAFSGLYGKKNVAFLLKSVEGVDVINVLFVEISGEKNVTDAS